MATIILWRCPTCKVNKALPQESAFGPRKTARCTGTASGRGSYTDHWPVEMVYVSSMQVDDEEAEAAGVFEEPDEMASEDD